MIDKIGLYLVPEDTHFSKEDIEVTLPSDENLNKSKVFQKVGTYYGGTYWTSAPAHFNGFGFAGGFYVAGSKLYRWHNVSTSFGVRPILKSNSLKELIKGCKSHMDNGIQVIEFGTFPHMLENVEIDDTSVLEKTGKEYILPAKKFLKMSLVGLTEYDYNAQKVVEEYCLYYPVKPIEWYVDKTNNMLISKKVLFLAPINVNNSYYNGLFKTSQLYRYLNNDFLRQLFASEVLNRENTDKIDDLSSLEAKVRGLRSQNESKREKINKLETLLKKQEQLQRESAELDAKIAELTQKLNQKVKK